MAVGTWREGLAAHNNSYEFDPLPDTADHPEVNLSVGILYYNTGSFFEQTAAHLRNAIENTSTDVEVIIVDDGSEQAPPSQDALDILASTSTPVKVIRHSTNRGRTAGRNTCLQHASGDIILYLDSDTIPDDQQLRSHAAIHSKARSVGQQAIVGSLFEYAPTLERRLPERITPQDVSINDWRVNCQYQPNWIGCDSDKAFVGRQFALLCETDNWRNWQAVSENGQYGPWLLPNMVLGGMFSADRRELQQVGGFDERFRRYGFDETPGVTKLLAARKHVAVPNLVGGGITFPNPGEEETRAQKDAAFRRAHKLFFGTFLQEQATP